MIFTINKYYFFENIIVRVLLLEIKLLKNEL